MAGTGARPVRRGWGRRRLWLGGALLALALPAAGLGLAAALLDPEDYKPQIAAAVERATGRALALRGPVRIGRSLWPTIEVEDATLANLPGGSRPDMVQVERVEARLSLPALLRRRLDIASLTLVGPNILLEFVEGRPNWVLGEPAAPGGTAPPAAAGPSIDVRVAGAAVRNGMVTLRLPGRTHVVGIRDLAFRRPAEGGPVSLEAELVYQDNASFRMSATATPTGGLTDPWETRLGFEAFGATVAAEGRMSLDGAYDLRAEARAPALSRLNALLPPMRLPALAGLEGTTHLASGPDPGGLPVIGETRLRFASGDLGDRAAGLRLGAVELALPGPGGTAAVGGTGRYAERDFRFDGTFSVPQRPERARQVPVTLRARAMPRSGQEGEGSLEMDGRMALREAAFDGLEGTIDLRLPALAAWQPLLPAVLPALTAVALRGEMALPADLATVRLREAALTSRQVEAAGAVTLGLGSRLALEGALRVARLDLDALLSPGPARQNAAPGRWVIPDTPLPWDWVRGREVDLTAAIAALTLRGQVWRDVDLALEMTGNRLQLAQARLRLPAGPAELAVSADASAREVPVTLRLRAPGVPLGLMTRTLALPGEASGALRLEAQLRARGRSARDLAASLTGPFSATMGEGGLDNRATVRIASAALEALGADVPAGGRTAIRCLGVAGAFQDGTGTLRTLALDSTHLRVAGAGTVDLGAERLDLALRPLARVAGSEVEVPVVVEGPFRAVEGRLEADALDRIGLLLNALTGGDRPRTCEEAGLLP